MVESNRQQWARAVADAPTREAVFETMSGIPLDAAYGPDDGEYPGQYPYTRGPYASMYRSKLWTMRMFAGFGTADDTNWRFKEIIRAGGDGLSTAFDMPTLLGIDSDDAMALGEVGRCGVAVDTLADMEDLYAGIDLGEITTSMTINSPAAPIMAMFVAQAEAAFFGGMGICKQRDIGERHRSADEPVALRKVTIHRRQRVASGNALCHRLRFLLRRQRQIRDRDGVSGHGKLLRWVARLQWISPLWERGGLVSL